jgi:hypothetical protein
MEKLPYSAYKLKNARKHTELRVQQLTASKVNQFKTHQ